MANKPEPHHGDAPAFPAAPYRDSWGEPIYGYLGMTHRDWIAGQAIASLAAAYGPMWRDNEFRAKACAEIAKVAYQIADAAIEARDN